MKTIKDAVIELGGKWPSAIPEDISSQHCKLYVNSMGTYIPANDVCAHDFVCTREEFNAAADQVRGKPDWSEVLSKHPDAQYLAQCPGDTGEGTGANVGLWISYDRMPECEGGYLVDEAHEVFHHNKGSLIGDWRNTLEKRPEHIGDANEKVDPLNGYLWGVEYPTDGKRPELPDDVLIEIKNTNLNGWSEWQRTVVETVFRNEVSVVTAFKIIDERYRPADTSYLLEPNPEQVAETAESKAESASDWWDYEVDNYISTCPIGAAVVVICDELSPLSEFGETFLDQECVVKSTFKNKHDFNMVSVEKADGECCCFVLRLIKPLDHATRKAEAEKKRVVAAAQKECVNFSSNDLGRLYDAGLLRLPDQK